MLNVLVVIYISPFDTIIGVTVLDGTWNIMARETLSERLDVKVRSKGLL